MKCKLPGVLIACLATLATSQAAVVTVNMFANTTVGFVTDGASDTLIPQTGGFVRLYTSSTDLTPASLSGLTGTNTIASFEALLADRLTVRTTAFNGLGAFQSTGGSELGPIGGFMYVLISNADSSKLGIFQSVLAPGLGTISINPASNITEDLLGTSNVQTIGSVKSGWQLAAVPEPSVALLGVLGAFGFLRRRRI